MENKKRNITGLSFLILGIVVLVIGIIAVNNTDMSKYKQENDRHESFTETYSAENIDEIKLSFSLNDYRVVFDENATDIKVDCTDVNKELLDIKTEKNTFKLDEDSGTNINKGIFHFEFFGLDLSRADEIDSITDIDKLFYDGDGEVTITIPARLYDDVKITAGVGNVDVQGGECKTFKLSAGVGNVDINGTKAQECDFSAGVGNVDCSEVSFESFDLSAGMGNVKVRGFLGDTKLSCGVGNVELHIKNSSDNYNFKGDDVDIHRGGNSTSDEEYDIKISTGLGDCDIYFE